MAVIDGKEKFGRIMIYHAAVDFYGSTHHGPSRPTQL
eukprot:COSAG02_NODE_5577_length_4217_cov_2.366926_2_plen_37_part_00